MQMQLDEKSEEYFHLTEGIKPIREENNLLKDRVQELVMRNEEILARLKDVEEEYK